MTTRTGPGGAAVALALLFLAGCGSKAPPPAATPSAGSQGAAATSPTPSSSPDASDTEALAAARAFLTAADQGNPDVAKVSPAFKQLIGPPTTAADQSRGYSDWAAEQWLKEALTGKAKTTTMWAGAVAPDTVIVTAFDPGQAGRAVLRMVKGGSGFQVDWVHVGPQKDRANLRGDQLAASFAAHAFLDTLVAGQHKLTESLLTTALKARIAPPLNDPLGYNRAMLGVKLTALRGKATEWKSAGGTEAVTGQLLEPGGKERPFTLKLVKGPRPGDWLVDDFDVK